MKRKKQHNFLLDKPISCAKFISIFALILTDLIQRKIFGDEIWYSGLSFWFGLWLPKEKVDPLSHQWLQRHTKNAKTFCINNNFCTL